MKAFQLIPGDILRRPDGTSEVVRGVFLIVQMANGMDHRYAITDDVQIVEQNVRPLEEPPRSLPGEPPFASHQSMSPPVPLAKPVPEESTPSVASQKSPKP